MRNSEEFDIEVTAMSDGVVLALSGALDLESAPTLAILLEWAHAERFKRIVLDIRGLSFMDSTGAQLLVSEQSRGGADGYGLSLVYGPGPVQRLISVGGLEKAFSVSLGRLTPGAQ